MLKPTSAEILEAFLNSNVGQKLIKKASDEHVEKETFEDEPEVEIKPLREYAFPTDDEISMLESVYDFLIEQKNYTATVDEVLEFLKRAWNKTDEDKERILTLFDFAKNLMKLEKDGVSYLKYLPFSRKHMPVNAEMVEITLKKLAQIANDLDAMGDLKTADMVDSTIKELQSMAGTWEEERAKWTRENIEPSDEHLTEEDIEEEIEETHEVPDLTPEDKHSYKDSRTDAEDLVEQTNAYEFLNKGYHKEFPELLRTLAERIVDKGNLDDFFDLGFNELFPELFGELKEKFNI